MLWVNFAFTNIRKRTPLSNAIISVQRGCVSPPYTDRLPADAKAAMDKIWAAVPADAKECGDAKKASRELVSPRQT